MCIGPVKIVVPCGDGNLTVRELIAKSIARYKKATGKVSLTRPKNYQDRFLL